MIRLFISDRKYGGAIALHAIGVRVSLNFRAVPHLEMLAATGMGFVPFFVYLLLHHHQAAAVSLIAAPCHDSDPAYHILAAQQQFRFVPAAHADQQLQSRAEQKAQLDSTLGYQIPMISNSSGVPVLNSGQGMATPPPASPVGQVVLAANVSLCLAVAAADERNGARLPARVELQPCRPSSGSGGAQVPPSSQLWRHGP
eukprot:SAG31_NODE_16047_length_725_cov_1.669329_1_plen_198_part_10